MLKRFLKVLWKEIKVFGIIALVSIPIVILMLPLLLLMVWLPTWLVVTISIGSFVIIGNWEEIKNGK